MQIRHFLGKRINIHKMKMVAGDDCFYDAADYDDTEFAVAVIMLKDFESEITDRFGYTDYSLTVFIDDDRIASLERVGHIHMCGCQCMENELRRFPHKSLEQEAEEKLNKVMLENN